MIIFDTSVLFGLSPDDPKFDLLRALKKSGQEDVAIPWMVQEELVAQRVLRYAEAHAKAVSASRELTRVAPWRPELGPREFSRDEASDYWHKAYGRVFEIIDTSGDVARQALLREANCEKPAKTDTKDKGGARDVAIWLSVIEYLKDNPEEKVFFVTGNTRDFGDGSEFPAPMSDDRKGLEDRLQILTSFDSVVSKFSTPLEINEEDTERDLANLLTSDAALSLLASTVKQMSDAQHAVWSGNAAQPSLPGLTTSDQYPQVIWNTWAREPEVILRGVRDAAGHKIGEDAWYTATVDWVLVGLASTPIESPSTTTAPGWLPRVRWVACEWRTKLLFSTRPGEPPTILQYGPPRALDPAERDWQPLVQKALPQTPLPQFTGPASDLASLVVLVAQSLGKKKDPSDDTP